MTKRIMMTKTKSNEMAFCSKCRAFMELKIHQIPPASKPSCFAGSLILNILECEKCNSRFFTYLTRKEKLTGKAHYCLKCEAYCLIKEREIPQEKIIKQNRAEDMKIIAEKEYSCSKCNEIYFTTYILKD